jgi:peptidoglycan/LPS O-acetylase OafA/YrhL
MMPRQIAPPPAPPFDRIAATFAALVVVGLAVFLLVRNTPISDPKLFFVLRVVLSFSAGTLGATLPGFLNVRWSGNGLTVRAGGALALFLLTFVYTPDLVTDHGGSGTQINQSSSGDLSPPINRNSGKITIQGGKN